MRGAREWRVEMPVGVTAKELVPADHPVRRIRVLVYDVVAGLSPGRTEKAIPPSRWCRPAAPVGSKRWGRQLAAPVRSSMDTALYREVGLAQLDVPGSG